MKFITLIKPVPQNAKLKRGKGSRLYLSEQFSTTWEIIQNQWRAQCKEQALTGNCSVSIRFGWSQMDIDSCIKPILDYLQGIAYKNDKQIVRLSIVRCKEKEITVEVTEIKI
jgi:Holliday junction resolvase RusA-like endonuclease